MPIRISGMIGVAPPAGETTVHIIAGGVSKEYTRDFAQAHDQAGFDWALVGYSSRSADGFGVASFCAANTERLGYLIAHRPGFIEPTLAARKIATFDNLHGGRIAVHIIAGVSDAEQRMDGDFQPKDVRYCRAAEYLSVMRRVWTISATALPPSGGRHSSTCPSARSLARPRHRPGRRPKPSWPK